MSALRDRAIATIERCSDPTQLRTFAKNALRQGDEDVARAAQLRLYEVLPSA